MNSEADQSSLTITNIPETSSGNLDTFFICGRCEPVKPFAYAQGIRHLDLIHWIKSFANAKR